MKPQRFLQVLRSVAQEHFLGVLVVLLNSHPLSLGSHKCLPDPCCHLGNAHGLGFLPLRYIFFQFPSPGYLFLWRARARRRGTSPLCIPHQDVLLITAVQLCPAGLAGWSWGLCQPCSPPGLCSPPAQGCCSEMPCSATTSNQREN